MADRRDFLPQGIQTFQRGLTSGFRHQDHEFLATIAAYQIGLAQALTQKAAKTGEYPVAGGTRPMTDDPTEQILAQTWRPALSVTGLDGAPAPQNAGNVLRHGKAETFNPPELSDLDGRSDRKTRVTMSECFPCPECHAVLSPGRWTCSECGHEMGRRNMVDFKSGNLVEHDTDAERAAATISEMRDLYLELRYVHEAHGKDRDKAANTAYAQLIGEFKFKPFVADEVWYVGDASAWTRNRLSVGVIKEFNSRFTAELFYLRQNDGRARPGNLNVIGTLLRVKLWNQ